MLIYIKLNKNLMDIKKNDIDKYDEIVEEFETQQFKDFVDFVMWIEF